MEPGSEKSDRCLDKQMNLQNLNLELCLSGEACQSDWLGLPENLRCFLIRSFEQKINCVCHWFKDQEDPSDYYETCYYYIK